MPVAETTNPGLLQQVTRLGRLDPVLVERLRHEALTVPSEWVAEYGQYQSGGWWTLSLLNNTGIPTDVTIKDCDPVETTLLKRMPATRRFLSSLNLRYMWVRLAQLGPDRLHLILDCYADANLARLSDSEQLGETDIVQLPAATKAQLDKHLATARSLVSLGYERSAEKYLLRLFYDYALPEGCVYDLVASLYDSLELVTEAESWRVNKAILLGLP